MDKEDKILFITLTLLLFATLSSFALIEYFPYNLLVYIPWMIAMTYQIINVIKACKTKKE